MNTPLHDATLRSPFVRRISESAGKMRLLKSGDRILVAVSGGPDSVALLSVLAALAPSWRLTLWAVHFNYGLRGEESDEDARFVVDLCERWNVELICESITVRTVAPVRTLRSPDGAGINCVEDRITNPGHTAGARRFQKACSFQEAAREARYHAMLRIGGALRVTKIAVGHTVDDQAETFLMWMLRGAGLAGLSGIPSVRESLFIRPLLEISRADILAYLKEEGLTFRTDSSNAKPLYVRNRIRHDLLPVLKRFNPSIVKVLGRQTDILREDDACLDQMATAHLHRLTRDGPKGACTVDRDGLIALPPALQRRIVRMVIRQTSRIHKGPAFAAIEAVLHRVVHGRSGASLVVQGIHIGREYGTLQCRPAQGMKTGSATTTLWAEMPLPVPSTLAWLPTGQVIQTRLLPSVPSFVCKEQDRQPAVALCDADHMTMNLTVRGWKPGDDFQPLGMNGRRKKLQDYFSDIKLPRRDRVRVPLIVAPDGIVWIGGCRMDHRFRITPMTTRVLMITLAQPPDENGST